jgi:hypothetical protein
MKTLLIRFVIWLTRRFVKRIDLHSKCPACGMVKKHKISFVQERGVVVHTCAVCGALWGQDPIVSLDLWSKSHAAVKTESVLHVPARTAKSK